MKYIIMSLSLLAMTTISCSSVENEKENPSIDSLKIDYVDERTELVDTVKKKSAKNPFISKWSV